VSGQGPEVCWSVSVSVLGFHGQLWVDTFDVGEKSQEPLYIYIQRKLQQEVCELLVLGAFKQY